MNLQELTDAIENDVLNLCNRGLTTKDIENIIDTIIKNQTSFGSVTGILLANNNMDHIPRNFQQLYEFMEESASDFLEINGNPFNKAGMSEIIYALQCKNAATAISIRLFTDDVMTSEQCQRFIYNNLLKMPSKLDPKKELGSEVLLPQLIKKAKKLLKIYGMEVNTNSDHDSDTKLRSLVVKDFYDFKPEILESQAKAALTAYYSPKKHCVKRLRY